jgi:hypothetical protein
MAQLRIQFASVPDEEHVVAEMLAADEEFGHIARRDSRVVVVLYQSEGNAVEIEFEQFVDLLTRAKAGLGA